MTSEHALLRAFLIRLGSTFDYAQPTVADRAYQAVAPRPVAAPAAGLANRPSGGVNAFLGRPGAEFGLSGAASPAAPAQATAELGRSPAVVVKKKYSRIFSYYGGKSKIAHLYPAPRHDVIVEPFAGSAGYSALYSERQVHINEKDEITASAWQFLLRPDALDYFTRWFPVELIRSESILDKFHADIDRGFVNVLRAELAQGSFGCESYRTIVTPWCARDWHQVRERLEFWIPRIAHWQLTSLDYANVPNRIATWFIDPPYDNAAGSIYRTNGLNYDHLAQWSIARTGQVMVCENEGAKWLPFRYLTKRAGSFSGRDEKAAASGGEVIWESGVDPVVAPVVKPSALAFALARAEPPAAPQAAPQAAPPPDLANRPDALAFAATGQPGPSVAGLAAALAERLAGMGHQLLARGGKLFVSDASRLSDEDRAAVNAIKSELLSLATPWPEPSLVTFLGHASPREQIAWTAKEPPSLDGIDTLEFDTETTGLRWWENDRPIGLSGRRPDGSTFYLPWGHAGGNLDEAVVKRWCERELRGKHLVGAGVKFDVNMMKSWGIDLEEQGCTLSDVQIYAALLDDSRKKFNLDILSKDFLGKEKTGHELDKTRMATYHASEVASYAESDAALTAELRAVMMPLLDAEDLQRVRQLEDAVIYPVCHMERNGAPLDLELLDRWVKESETKYNNCMWMLAKETGQSINPDAARDLEKLFEHLHLPIVRLPSGAPSFTDAILKRIDHPVIKQVRFATKLSDLRSRYLLKYQKAVSSDGILRYAMHQTRYQKDTGEEGGVGPGRFSSSELTDGVGCNIQQVMKLSKQRKAFGYPADDVAHDDEIHLIRKLMVPQRGRWLSADLMQVEFRLFSHYAGNKTLLQAYRDDPLMSFHDKAVEMVRPHYPDVIYDEQKNWTFAYLYGAKTIKQAVMMDFITAEEGKIIRDAKDWDNPKLARTKKIASAFNGAIPEAERLMKKCAKLAEERGWIKTMKGRRARFSANGEYHKSMNNLLQGGSADYMKEKLIEVHRERKNTGLLLRFSVHDELDGDAQEPDTLAKVQAILDRQSWPELNVPLLWDVNLGGNWAEAK